MGTPNYTQNKVWYYQEWIIERIHRYISALDVKSYKKDFKGTGHCI